MLSKTVVDGPDVDGPLYEISVGPNKIYLFGTAHVSKKSADDVSSLVLFYRPKAVAIELCEGRYEALTNPDRWKNTDIFTLIKSGKSAVLLIQLFLSAHQKRIAKKLNIEPGAEMRAAISAANEINSEIILIDRDIKITMRRAWASVSWTMLFKILLSGFSSNNEDEITEEEIEKLKQEDQLISALNEFSDKLPEIKKVIVDERDTYMSSVLLESMILETNTTNNKNNSILAVVGAGHISGMKNLFSRVVEGPSHSPSIDRTEVSKLPPPTLISKTILYGIPAFLVLSLIYIFITFDYQAGLSLIGVWCLSTGICAAIGATIALAHPLSILSAGLIAPIAAIHPGIATGWVSGFVEAIIRKPTVNDFDTITEDLTSTSGMNISGLWKNRVLRILLVVGFSNLGCMIGMGIGSLSIIEKLFK